MLRAAVTISLLIGVAACATPPVKVDRYRGVYTTHFGGIPDQSRICAVLTNYGASDVAWVSMRLRVRSGFQSPPQRWDSRWLYRGRLAPGQTVTVELETPPVAEEIELDVVRAGSGGTPAGRPARAAPACTQASLLEAAEREAAARSASGVEHRPSARPADPSSDLLIASDP